jgi:two-component system nitrogen regulation response regulator NtrX
MIMVPGDTITASDLAFLEGAFVPYAEPAADAGGGDPVRLQAARARFERDFILKALAAQNGNISRTADALGVERSNLYRKMRALGIAVRGSEREEETV